MKKILKEQITQGNCANYQYLYNPNPSPWSWIDNIVAQFGITQNFGDYYTQRPNISIPNCCVDENGDCLMRIHTLHANSPNMQQTAPMYAGQYQAQNWKTLIDQLNTIHQTNNEPANFDYSDTVANVQQKMTIPTNGWVGYGQGPIAAAGNICSGCDGPVSPPGTTVTQATDDVKNTTTTDDDSDRELNCKHTPEEGCWACHGNSQAGGSCWQPPQMWIDTYHPSLGYNFYDTETDCVNAGPLCKKDEEKSEDKKDKVTQDISEDIKRMKKLIKY